MTGAVIGLQKESADAKVVMVQMGYTPASFDHGAEAVRLGGHATMDRLVEIQNPQIGLGTCP